MIRLEGLVKSFGSTRALDGVDVEFDAGRAYGVVGPNGCGKTTLFRILTGLLTHDAGSVTVMGGAPSDVDPTKVGYMPQREALYRDLTVRENVRFFAELCGLRGQVLASQIDEVLRLTALVEHQTKTVEQLSGGMARRTSLSCAIVHRPSLLFLDEPTVGVDPKLRIEFWDHFADLKNRGTTILVSTHHLDEARRCDELVLLRAGRVLAKMPPEELLSSTNSSTVEEAFLKLAESGE